MANLFASAAVLALVAANPALAQNNAGSNAPAPSSGGTAPGGQASVGDIIVTARKRAESLRDIPSTVSAVTAATLAERGPITGTTDLLDAVPGVRFNNVGGSNLSEVSIRGSGTERATGADSGVGLYVNGAYIGSSTLSGRNFKNIDYFDLERVEVQEGPQGALYGRNSEYGDVNIVLANPKFENSGSISDTYTGGLDQNHLTAVVNRKLSDDVAVRVGGETYGQTRGFYYDPNNNRYYDRTTGWAGRAQVRVKSGRLDVTALIDGENLNLPSFVNSWVLGPGVSPAFPAGFMQSRFILPHSGLDALKQTSIRGMVMANYSLDWATITSTSMITRWHSAQQYAGSELDLAAEGSLRAGGQLGAYPFSQISTDTRDRTIYQDLRLAGTTAGGQVQWLVGAEGLFQHDRYQAQAATNPCTLTLTSGICGGTPAQPICYDTAPTNTPCPSPYPLPYGTDGTTNQQVSSEAAYASLKYSMGHFSFDVEGRITHDRKAATQTVYNLYTTVLAATPSNFVFEKTQPTWATSLSYKMANAQQTRLYIKIGTGYRAGGVNLGLFNAKAPNPLVYSYSDETTISYEAGIKTDLLPGMFFILDGYLSRTKDAIASITDGCTVTVCGTGQTTFNVNGGNVHAKGVEASLNDKLALGGGTLNLALNGSWQRANYVSITPGVTGLPLLNSSVAQIPKWVMSASVNYRHAITQNATGFINMLYSGQRGGVQDTVTAATPPLSLSDFDQFTLSGGVNLGPFEASVWVKNLTNETIQLLKFQLSGSPYQVRYNAPRTIGGTLTYHF